jgi:hypothetical protein
MSCPGQVIRGADTGTQTRQKLKEAYTAEFAATIERAEKQIILAKHGRRLLHLLDDTPIVPGDARAHYGHGAQARQILNDAEDDLRDWRPEEEEDEAYQDPGKQEQQQQQLAIGSAGHETAGEQEETAAGTTTASEGERFSGANDGVKTEATSQKSPLQHDATDLESSRAAETPSTGPHSQPMVNA